MTCNAATNSLRVLLGPFWWEIGFQPVWLLAVGSTWHFLLLVVLSTLFFIRSRETRPIVASLGVLAIFSLAVFGALLTNYGLLLRFRAMTEILLIPTAVGGLLTIARTRSQSWPLKKKAVSAR